MSIECPKCQTDNPENAKFCKECGNPFTKSNQPGPTETLETPTEELTTGSTFAGRYQIIEELGRGGMGRVYKVVDTEVNEKIALKLIKPEIASDKKTIERFRNELKFARKIRHRNVCQMYDLSREQGSYYITMEYVSGEDLKGLIKKMGQLSAGQAIVIAKQVCEGLSEAHKLGVVHRDLKPQNIMIDKEGNARIMDFGIARSIEGKSITGAGVMIGTPDYMSPEQVDGKETDQRSDIYSLGIILYEMVTGRTPFEGETAFTIGVKHKSETPKPPKEWNAQIPDDLNKVILRCLEKEKERRYRSAGELRSDLSAIEQGIPTTDRMVPKVRPTTSREVTVTFSPKKVIFPALIIFAFIAAVIVVWQVLLKKEAMPGLPDKPSIAVLPFKDLSPQKDQEVFCEGLPYYIIAKLTKLGELKVIQGDSAMHYKDAEKLPQIIGKELVVDAVLHGSIHKSGDNIQVLPILMAVSDGSIIWSDEFTEREKDVLDVQSTIALRIAEHLQTELTSDDREGIEKKPTASIEAYNLYERGRYLWRKRGQANVLKAVQYLEQAVAIDPDFALAYAGLADCYVSLTYGRPLEEAQKIEEYASKALELDRSLAEAHVSLASFRLSHEWDFKGAKQEFERAIALNPGYATAHHWYGRYYWWTGEADKAVTEMKLAQELDPHSPSINRNLAGSYLMAGQYDLALEALNRVLEIDANHVQVHLYFGYCYLSKAMYDKALEEFIKEFGPDSLGAQFWEMVIHAHEGETDKARDWIERIEEQSYSEETIYPYLMAYLWALLGERDKVFFYLDKAYTERDPNMVMLQSPAVPEEIRSDPRYEQLLKRMGLK